MDNRPILRINLAHLQYNYKIAQEKVGKVVNCAAVIKDNAYGLGAMEVMQSLREVGCKDFYFISFTEVMNVMHVRDGTEIFYIIGPLDDDEMNASLRAGCVPVLSSLREVERFIKTSSRYSGAQCVLHFDTGMNRLGMNAQDCQHIDISKLKVRYIMSHLACADEPDHPLNKKQLQEVQAIGALFPGVKVSLANSSGVFLGKEYHMNQVRVGCMLYGVNPTPYNANSPVKHVAMVEGKVVCIRTLENHGTISYGATIEMPAGTKIATVSVGYADGYLRCLSNKGRCFVDGRMLPLLGRVTMDFIMVDVSALSESELGKLDYVEVMGPNITVDEIAKHANTIGYEVLTSLHGRHKRVYEKVYEKDKKVS